MTGQKVSKVEYKAHQALASHVQATITTIHCKVPPKTGKKKCEKRLHPKECKGEMARAMHPWHSHYSTPLSLPPLLSTTAPGPADWPLPLQPGPSLLRPMAHSIIRTKHKCASMGCDDHVFTTCECVVNTTVFYKLGQEIGSKDFLTRVRPNYDPRPRFLVVVGHLLFSNT